ncbi:MAG: aspartate carbamoyltransferase [Paenibacillus sp. RIFOXYA1_FULL_44_5]|nr:MAG: aspartate carbamoyltransferase [Paenibacillus sp. RIFOXYA1_FULL_44_5]
MLKTDRELLGIRALSEQQIIDILDRAAYWHQQTEKINPVIQNKFIANMFFENSTRTRFSFEMAEKKLGAQVLNFAAAASSVEKGESIYDTIRTLESMGIDAGVVRMKPNGLLEQIAHQIHIPLINAGDGNNEHPTQALLDFYTMRNHFGALKGLKVSIIGDISHSRVARSNLWGLQKLGAEVQFCAPPNMRAVELEPFAPYVSMEEAIKADVVMMLRVQFERHEKNQNQMVDSVASYRSAYGLTEDRLTQMASHAIIMHPAPVNRNVEIDDAVVEHEKSKIFTQMSNGVPIRMAVIERALQ